MKLEKPVLMERLFIVLFTILYTVYVRTRSIVSNFTLKMETVYFSGILVNR
jgi:hypothetical protein